MVNAKMFRPFLVQKVAFPGRDKSWFWVYTQRLEAGRFKLRGLADSMQIDVVQREFIWDGVKLQGHVRSLSLPLKSLTGADKLNDFSHRRGQSAGVFS